MPKRPNDAKQFIKMLMYMMTARIHDDSAERYREIAKEGAKGRRDRQMFARCTKSKERDVLHGKRPGAISRVRCGREA